MKSLSGKELAGFIKERQAKQVAGLISSFGTRPKLAIIQVKDDPVIDTYVNLKKKYGADIGVAVEHHKIAQTEVGALIKQLNNDQDVHGMIVQLPLQESTSQDHILNLVSPNKDVDGLSDKTLFDAATPTAILWLLSGFNVALKGKKVAIVGKGVLVGDPLARLLSGSGVDISTYDRSSRDLGSDLVDADIVVSATGSPGIIKEDMLKHGAIVVDAGVAVEKGVAKGDLDDGVYSRDDLILTPKKGGVGPLTVCALFENVIKAVSLAKS